MKLLTNAHQGNSFSLPSANLLSLIKLTLLSAFLFISNQALADCIVNRGETVYATNDPFNGCTGTITILGTLVINANYNLSTAGFSAIDVDEGTIQWSGNFDFALPENLPLTLTNGGNLSVSGPCNSNRTLTFGTALYASCNGNGANFSFAEVNANGGANSSELVPVEMTYFAAEAKQDAVLLEWQTATEQDNLHFLVQHSANGREFEDIGKLDGAGTTSRPTDYQFQDYSPEYGINYYRLLQVDYDGTETFSDILAVNFEKEAIKISGIAPNPAKDFVQISHSYTEDTPAFEIYNAFGQVVKASFSSSGFETTVSLPDNLPAGYYAIRLNHNQSTTTFPLIIK